MFIVLAGWHSLFSCNKMSHKCGIVHLYQGLRLTVMSLSQPQVAALVRWTDNHFTQYAFNLFTMPFKFSGFKKKKNCAGRLCFYFHFHLPSKVRRGRRLTFWKISKLEAEARPRTNLQVLHETRLHFLKERRSWNVTCFDPLLFALRMCLWGSVCSKCVFLASAEGYKSILLLFEKSTVLYLPGTKWQTKLVTDGRTKSNIFQVKIQIIFNRHTRRVIIVLNPKWFKYHETFERV